MDWRQLAHTKLTPAVRVQLAWAILFLALMGMLELANDTYLAAVYLAAIVSYFGHQYHPYLGYHQPYRSINVMLVLAAVYIFFRFF